MKIFIETTGLCNYDCIYCFRSNKTKTMDMKLFKKTINWIKKNVKEPEVLLEGGEALLNVNILKMGEYAKKKLGSVNLGTNASLVYRLTDKEMKRIKETFNEVSVGFDTPNAILYNEMTRDFIFCPFYGIDRFLYYEIPVKIGAVVTKYNLKAKPIIDFCLETGIKKLRFYWFIPREKTDESLLPTEKQYKDFLKEVEKLNNKKLDVKVRRYYEEESLLITPEGKVFMPMDNQRINLKQVYKII